MAPRGSRFIYKQYLYFCVVPAKAGTQERNWMPVFTGMMSWVTGANLQAMHLSPHHSCEPTVRENSRPFQLNFPKTPRNTAIKTMGN